MNRQVGDGIAFRAGCSFAAIILVFASVPLPGACADPTGTTPAAEQTYQEARRYLKGDGVPKDAKRAFEMMQRAADAGIAEAIGGLGYFYLTGTGVLKDDKQAVAQYRKGAEMGGARAQFNLGQVLLNGIGAEKDVETGLSWIRKAAARAVPEAVLVLGNVYYFGQLGQRVNYAEALAYLRVAAEQGNAEAQNTVGVMCESGLAQPRDESKAMEWYRKAAEQNLPKAQANLGRMLGPTGGKKAIRIVALMWLYAAEAQGEITAQKILQEIDPGIDPQERIEAKKQAVEFQRTRRLRPFGIP